MERRHNRLLLWRPTIISMLNYTIYTYFRIAKEHGKTPQQVVIMENYHHLHAKLSALKISVLDNFKKDAKQR